MNDQELKEKNAMNVTKALFLIALILGIIILFIYLYFNAQNETTNGEEKIPNITLNNYIEYSIIRDEQDNYNTYYYLIGKRQDGSWEEIINSNDQINIIGYKENKLYISDSIGFAYIDFNQSNPVRTSWIEFPVPEMASISEYAGAYPDRTSVYKAVLINDTIYFSYSTFAGGYSDTDGILTLNLTDQSFDDAKRLIPKADFGWEFDKNNNLIYYLEYNVVGWYELLSYDISNGTSTSLFKNVEGFELYDNKILYYIINYSTTPINNGVYEYFPATYDLYLYDINSQNNKFIYSSPDSPTSGSIWSYGEFINNDVYYKVDNKIIKYNDGKNDIIFTYSGPSDLYGFYSITDDTIKLVIDESEDKYLINNRIEDSLPGNATISVKMLDKTIKNFSIEYVN